MLLPFSPLVFIHDFFFKKTNNIYLVQEYSTCTLHSFHSKGKKKIIWKCKVEFCGIFVTHFSLQFTWDFCSLFLAWLFWWVTTANSISIAMSSWPSMNHITTGMLCMPLQLASQQDDKIVSLTEGGEEIPSYLTWGYRLSVFEILLKPTLINASY